MTFPAILSSPAASATLFCDHCGRSQHEVAHLVASPTANICSECVAVAVEIIAQAEQPALSIADEQEVG